MNITVKNAAGLVLRYLVVFSAVCMAVMVSTWIVPVRFELMEGINSLGAAFMAIAMVNFALTALVLFLYLRFSRTGGWRLAVGLLGVFWGAIYVMSQIESLIFNEALTSMTTRDIIDNVLRGLISNALSVPIAMWLTGRFKKGTGDQGAAPRIAVSEYAWKIPIGGALYVVVYWLFGYFVAWQFPAVREYYSGSTELVPFFPYTLASISGSPWFMGVQFLRGALWSLIALLSVRILGGKKLVSMIGVGAVFTLFGLQLLVPNPMMPTAIRVPHLVETTASMLLYGVFLGWFLHPGRPAAAEEAV
jgi:hypothetical protein